MTKFDEVQYNILIRDVKLFNSLRKEKRYGIIEVEVGDYKANVGEANFSEICLYRADLIKADLSDANLSGAIMINPRLRSSNIGGCYIWDIGLGY